MPRESIRPEAVPQHTSPPEMAISFLFNLIAQRLPPVKLPRWALPAPVFVRCFLNPKCPFLPPRFHSKNPRRLRASRKTISFQKEFPDLPGKTNFPSCWGLCSSHDLWLSPTIPYTIVTLSTNTCVFLKGLRDHILCFLGGITGATVQGQPQNPGASIWGRGKGREKAPYKRKTRRNQHKRIRSPTEKNPTPTGRRDHGVLMSRDNSSTLQHVKQRGSSQTRKSRGVGERGYRAGLYERKICRART